MSIINLGNVIALAGLLFSSFSFSRGLVAVGLFFILMTIAGLLMNPPKCKEEIIQ